MKHLYKLQTSYSIPYNERSKKRKFDEMTNRCNVHGVSTKIIRDAHELYSEFLEAQKKHGKSKISRGNNIIEQLSGSLFYAFKNAGQTRNYKEIGKIMDLASNKVTEGVKNFFKMVSHSRKMRHKITCYTDFIDRFCNRLDLNDEIKDTVIKVTNRAKKHNILLNNNPSSMVAGSIYFVSSILCNLNLTKDDIATHCGLSSATISKIYSKLIANIECLLDD